MEKNLVLVLNCGSSSVKFAVIRPDNGIAPISGLIQRIGTNEAKIEYQISEVVTYREIPNSGYEESLTMVMGLVKFSEEISANLIAIGHRVVHGGEKFTNSVILNMETLEAIRQCIPLAPLHNPANIAGIEVAMKIFPDLKQVAVFDTAFHQTLPKHAYLYAIPYDLYQKHRLRRYGFHGTSHRFVSQKALENLHRDSDNSALITAHLGNGCSVTAVLNGKSIDTSMGLTPLEGLVMGTRSGDVDPGLSSYLCENLGYSPTNVTQMLNRESGMLGISGLDSDLRPIESLAEKGDERCNLALDIFSYRLAKYVASYMMVMGKLDALVFTGGIGENSRIIRARTLKLLSPLGFILDLQQNQTNGKDNSGIITDRNSKIIAMVVPTNEELMIARDTFSAHA